MGVFSCWYVVCEDTGRAAYNQLHLHIKPGTDSRRGYHSTMHGADLNVYCFAYWGKLCTDPDVQCLTERCLTLMVQQLMDRVATPLRQIALCLTTCSHVHTCAVRRTSVTSAQCTAQVCSWLNWRVQLPASWY